MTDEADVHVLQALAVAQENQARYEWLIENHYIGLGFLIGVNTLEGKPLWEVREAINATIDTKRKA